VAGLEGDDLRVHRQPERDPDAAQAHHRCRDAERPHRPQREQHDQRQGEEWNQGAAQVQEEREDDQHHHGDLLGQGRAQRLLHPGDHLRTVVNDHHLHAFRQPCNELGERGLHPGHHRGHVRFPAHEHHRTHRGLAPLEVDHCRLHRMLHADAGDVREHDRRTGQAGRPHLHPAKCVQLGRIAGQMTPDTGQNAVEGEGPVAERRGAQIHQHPFSGASHGRDLHHAWNSRE